MDTHVIGHADVTRLLPMTECIEVMDGVLQTLARGDAVLPLRQIVWLPDRTGALGVMPAYLGHPRTAGAKIVSVFPGNSGTPYESHQGAILLFECEHGHMQAMVDAGSVTAIRTAAVSGVATRALARPGASDLALLGAGTQAAMHLEAMLAVRPISRVRVWNRTPERAQRFAERESELRGIEIEVAPAVREAVDGADIICTTTAARSPILEGAWLSPGAHINAVGSSTPGFRELDSAAVASARLYVDRHESALNEADDIRVPLLEGAIEEGHIRGELGDLLLGAVEGRTGEQEITLFKSLGLAIEDLAAACHVYEKARDAGVGTAVDFVARRHG